MVNTHIYLVNTVPTSEVMQDSRFMEVSQLRHVVNSCRWRFRILGVNACEARHNRFAIGADDGGVAAPDLDDLPVDPRVVGILRPDMRPDDDVHRRPHFRRRSTPADRLSSIAAAQTCKKEKKRKEKARL
jgi:hypothetical protein